MPKYYIHRRLFTTPHSHHHHRHRHYHITTPPATCLRHLAAKNINLKKKNFFKENKKLNLFSFIHHGFFQLYYHFIRIFVEENKKKTFHLEMFILILM